MERFKVFEATDTNGNTQTIAIAEALCEEEGFDPDEFFVLPRGGFRDGITLMGTIEITGERKPMATFGEYFSINTL